MNYTYSEDELYHYGVLGMKWGIRRGHASEAYSKGVRKLQKYDQKADKARSRLTNKSQMMNKAATYNRKAAKYRNKSARAIRATTRLILPIPKRFAQWEVGRFERKAAKYDNKAAKITSKIAKQEAAIEKYSRKGEKLYGKMQKAFADVPVKDLNSADISAAKEYAKKHGLS